MHLPTRSTRLALAASAPYGPLPEPSPLMTIIAEGATVVMTCRAADQHHDPLSTSLTLTHAILRVLEHAHSPQSPLRTPWSTPIPAMTSHLPDSSRAVPATLISPPPWPREVSAVHPSRNSYGFAGTLRPHAVLSDAADSTHVDVSREASSLTLGAAQINPRSSAPASMAARSDSKYGCHCDGRSSGSNRENRDRVLS
jgi:hypothetical protein